MSDETNIAVEREKTKRLMITVGAGGVLGVLAMILFFNTVGDRKGDLDIDITSGKFKVSLDKPIGEQIQQPSSSLQTSSGDVQFSTGTISDSVVQRVEASGQVIDAGKFVGKNLINRKAGFVISAGNPSAWSIQNDDEGFQNPLVPVTQIRGAGGEFLNVTRGPMQGCSDVRSCVELTVESMKQIGLIDQNPTVRYDEANQTAFLTFTNAENGGQSYMKVVISNGLAYVAAANYNVHATDANTKNDLISMVASFSPISK